MEDYQSISGPGARAARRKRVSGLAARLFGKGPFFLLLICVLVGMVPQTAKAAVPYWTLSSDSNGRWIWTPDAFTPSAIWNGFKDPEDLFVTAQDEIYVADTGNDRIVELSRDGQIVRTFPDASRMKNGKPVDQREQLRKPEGVFISKTGEVYVADTGSRRIVVFDSQGAFLHEFDEPKDPAISKSYSFIPSKLVLDRRGYIFVANKGGYQGLLQLTPTGQFAGFFGANKVPMNWIESMKRKFYTDEQLKQEQAKLPGAITNLAVDGNGFIYTVNRDMRAGQLRLLNSGGVDLLKDHNFAPWVIPPNKFSFTSVSVDADGIITVLEAEHGRIYQYDSKGNLIFRFGGASDGSQRMGLFKRATSLGVLSDGTILVSDGDLNDIQLFKRTDFGSLVHRAITLYADGQYQQSENLWKEILLRNADYDRAFQGIAKAEYYKGNYKDAMAYYREAYDADGYSQAFWQIRMKWLLSHFATWMTVLLCGVVVLAGGRFAAVRVGWYSPGRRRGAPVDRIALSGWRNSFVQAFRILRHPLAGMEEIADGMKVKLPVAILLLLLAFLFTLFGKAVANFIFSSVRFEELNLKTQLETFLLPWLSWVVGSYLVGSVMKGQGTFRRVFIVNCYALMPIVLFCLPVMWISRVLTLQEAIVFKIMNEGMYAWVGILLFIGTMSVQNYNLKEAIKMTMVSLITVACLWVFGFVLVGLLYQSVDFFIRLGEELIERVT